MKDEPQSRTERDPVIETKPDSSMPTLDVKSEQKESERKEETTTSVKQGERTPEPDSEDSITVERVAEDASHRLSDTRGTQSQCSRATRSRGGSSSATGSSQRKQRLLQKNLGNKAMVLMLHKEQEG